MTATSKRPVRVLLVEDSPADVMLIKEALSETTVEVDLTLAEDGAVAKAKLADLASTDGAPDLVILDLNLPKVDGFQVLRWIRQHEDLAALPVVILTTSSSDAHVLQAYEDHANAYVRKPLDFESFVDAVREIEEFWFDVATLPPSERESSPSSLL